MGWLVRSEYSAAPPNSLPDAYLRTGFNYDFHTLDGGEKPNELNAAFRQLFANLRPVSLFGYLSAWFPFLKVLVSRPCSVIPSSGKRELTLPSSTLAK